jgi:hypothetical protein
MKHIAVCLFLVLVQPLAQAESAKLWSETEVTAERARIDALRSEANAKYDAADQVCKAQFVVMACENDVRLKRIAALAELRRQEVTLNDIVRKQTAEDQRQRLQKRLDERAGEDAKAAEAAATSANKVPKEKLGPQASAGATKTSKGSTAPSAAAMAENRVAYEQKLLAAKEKKQQRDARLAEKPSAAKPLPVPP